MVSEKISNRFIDIDIIPGNGYSPHTGCLIFRCFDTQLQASVTVKASDGIKNVHKTVQEEYEFIKEIKHPNVIKVLDYFESDGVQYMIMDGKFTSGGRRERWQNIFINYTEDMLIIFLDSLLSTLIDLQKINILHEDIECANIILNHVNNTPILIDFGRASIRNYTKEWLLSQLSLDKSTKQNAFFREIANIGGVYATEPTHFEFKVRPIIEEVLDKWENIS